MRWRFLGALGVLATGVRVARSRHRRALHPAGRSFTGELEVWGLPAGCGVDLIDTPGRHPATVRLSKGVGTAGGRPDVRGLAVRVHGQRPGERIDLLLSTAGTGRWSRHVPMPRLRFDAAYGSITSYRTGQGQGGKLYLAAVPDSGGAPLGADLSSVTAAAEAGARMLLVVADPDGCRPFARLSFGTPLPAAADAALAFDPIRNSLPGLRPTGLIHASRAVAYPLSQRWRGARRAQPPGAAQSAGTARSARTLKPGGGAAGI